MLSSDWIAIASLAAMIVSGLLPSAPLRAKLWWIAAGAGASAAVASLLLDRWQIVPALVVFGAASVAALGSPRVLSRLGVRAARGARAAGFVLLLAAGAFSVALLQQIPVFSLPEPTGEWRVGVTDFEVVEAGRPDPFTGSGSRRLMVRAWYPADQVDGFELRSYRTRREAGIISRNMAAALGMPPYFFRHLSRVRTHAWLDAPISTRRASYPAVVFSHGYLGAIDMHSALMEELASQGYVMLSVSHPHESAAVFFPDGEVVSLDPDVVSRMRERSIDEDARTLIVSDDIGARHAATRRLYGRDTPLARSTAVWRDDMLAVIDAVEAGRMSGAARSVAQRVDLQRVALAGMSFGGAAATSACHADARCRAVVNLDGREHTLELFDSDIRTPILMLSQGARELVAGLRYNDFHYEPAAEAGGRRDVLRFIVQGSGHWDFSDHTFLARWPASKLVLFPTVVGDASGLPMAKLLGDIVRAFLEDRLSDGEGDAVKAALARHPALERQDLSRIRSWATGIRHE